MAYIRQLIRVDGQTVTGWTPTKGGRPPARATWEVVVSLGKDRTGRYRQRTKRIVGSYTAAKDLGHELEATTSGRRADAGTITVAELIDRYIEHRRSIGRARKTIVGYESIAKRVKAALGAMRAARLDALDLDSYYSGLTTEGLDAATVAHHHAFIAQVLNQAVKWELVRSPHAADKATPPPLERPDPVSPEPVLAKSLIDAFFVEHPMLAAFVYLAGLTGCRRGEVCGWRWSSFDLVGGQLRVQRSITDAGGQVEVKQVKTKRPRPMAIDIRAAAVLDWLWRRYLDNCQQLGIEPDRDTYVFSQDPDHSTPWRPDRVTHTFGRKRALEARRTEAAALASGASKEEAVRVRATVEAIQLKQFRSFTQTQLLAAGVDVVTTAARGGHDPAVLLRHYAGVIPANDQAAANLLGEVLGSLFPVESLSEG